MDGFTGKFPSGRAEDRRLSGSAVSVVGLHALVRSRLPEMMVLRASTRIPRLPRLGLDKQNRQDAGVEIDPRHHHAVALARDAFAGRQCRRASAFGDQVLLQ